LLKDIYINPFTDFGFKKLFGTELNKDLLIDFLNEVILPDNKKIAELSYSSNERIGQTKLDRKAIFDLYCISDKGERFVVEMQKAKQNYFKDRSVFYASFPIQEQANSGEWDFKLSEVYTVGILDFTFDDESKITGNPPRKEVRHEVTLKNQFCETFYDKLTFIYLEMPNFIKTEEELVSNYDKWLFLLKHLPYLTERPVKFQEKVFNKLFEAAEIAKFSPEEKEDYEQSLKYYRDLKNVIDTAFTEGVEEGRKEGMEEGRNEEKIKNIVKALQRGKLSDAEIAEDFGTSLAELQQIRQKYIV
jgi:predicted transposase/invertase (TIGR01784 family)